MVAKKTAETTSASEEPTAAAAVEDAKEPDGKEHAVAKTVRAPTGRSAPARKATGASKRSTAQEVAEGRAAAEKSGAKKSTTAKKATATKKTTTKKTATAKKTTAKKTTPKKATAKRTAAKKAAEKAVAGKAPDRIEKRAPARKTAAKKAAKRAAPAAEDAAEAAQQTGVRTVGSKKTVAAGDGPAAVPTARAVAATVSDELAVRPGEDPWTPAEVEEARAELEGEVTRLNAQLATSEAALMGLMRDSGGGAGDDDADTGSKNITREHELSLAASAREMLEQTERALLRLEAGTYGVCENCGKPIGKARMQAFPRATLCVECKQKQERRG